jgi:nicotinate-nucleotide adenylyltransferase
LVLEQKKIAYFGGTFDPVHRGHIAVAMDALDSIGLDEICFLPAQHNPLKPNAPLASFEQRLQMIELAIEGYESLTCSDLEIQLPQPSYTVRVVEKLLDEHPDDDIHWIIGADQIESFHKWHRIEELCSLVTFLILERPGYELDVHALSRLRRLRYEKVPNRHMDMSATEVRSLIVENKCPQELLNEKVLAYIQKNNLYSPSFTNH